MTDYSLAHLTVLSLAPPAMIDIAARCGYQAVGLRLIAVTSDSPGYPLMHDKPMMRETKARLAATGIRVNDIELIKIVPGIDIPALEPLFAAGAELGARHAIVAPYDSELSRLADRLAAIADLAKHYGIGPVMEFFPWTDVSNLRKARAVVDAANRTNAGILVDVLHFDRSDSSLGELDTTPPQMLPFFHLCDAPAEKPTTTEGFLHTARAERLPPGDGGIDLRTILAHLPKGITAALEVPMTALTREYGPEEVARRAIAGAKRVMQGL
jgi:sugar phosphate isomerase/epimerase